MRWWQVIYNISESDINKFIGTDFAIVATYIKINAILFLIISLLACSVLLPLYLSGDPLPIDYFLKSGTFQDITMMNIMGLPNKLWVSFVIMLINTALTYFSMYKFWQQSSEYQFTYNDKVNISVGDIQLHTILIRNIPTYINLEEA